VDPNAPVHRYQLPWGRVDHFNIRETHRHLRIDMHAVVETLLVDPFSGVDNAASREDLARPEWVEPWCEWLLATGRVPIDEPECRAALEALAAAADERVESDGSAWNFLLALMSTIHGAFPFDPGATHVGTTLLEVMKLRRGVCQDFAHVMLGVCRLRGIPARYVSGYLYTGHGRHSGDVMHAWVECLVRGLDGRPIWRGFDPTNDLVAGRSYVKAFLGRDYGDVAPTRGVYSGSGIGAISVDVRVGPHEPIGAAVA
ncbi:MAG: transglutaminase-like domain-containing protein, partial [Armatimonadota bacterium]